MGWQCHRQSRSSRLLKLGEDISPAVSASLRLLCLLHNLMVLFEAGLAETGISNVAEEKRR